MCLGNADGTGFAELAFAERLANRLDPSARIRPSLENDGGTARFAKKPGRMEAGEAAADDDHRITRVGGRLRAGENRPPMKGADAAAAADR